MTPLGWLDPLGKDLRYAWRGLRRTPAFTAVAVLSLAIGIGANSAIFALLYSLLLQPLPVSHPEQLVQVQHTAGGAQSDAFSWNDYQALHRSPGFTSLTAIGSSGNVPLVVGSVSRSVSVDAVDGTFFSTIGLHALRGRLISPADERTRAPVVVISEGLWSALFNRAPSAIGSTITMQRAPFTIIGVVPGSFQGLAYPGTFQTAIPLSTLALVGGSEAETTAAGDASLLVVGRLEEGVSASRATALIAATWRSCGVANVAPVGAGEGGGVALRSIEHGIPSSKFDVAATFSRMLLELMGGAAIVLLAACANIGTLLLARASARRRELAIRLSLGASRGRIATQLLAESTLLATIGSVAGLVLAHWALQVIAHRLPGPLVDRVGLQLNGAILGFTAALAAGSVLLFGALPAWRATRTDLNSPLKQGSQSSSPRRAGFLDKSVVIVQIALALVLLNGAGLFVATLRNLRNVHGGFAMEHTVTAGLDARDTPQESAGIPSLADRLLARAVTIPGVRSAALSAAVPVFGGRRIEPRIAVEGYTPGPDEKVSGWLDPVTPGYFATLGIGLRAGRDFSREDGVAGQQVAIVNEAFVHQYLRGRNPLGALVRSIGRGDTILMQVVGVADDARYIDVRQLPPPMIFVPLAQFARIPVIGHIPVLNLTVRTAGDDRATPAALRSAVFAEAPDLRISGPETVESAVDVALNRETLTAELATLFGAVALIVAAIGLYGIVSYQVARRTREIGVRMALGAGSSSVVWMVLRQALGMVSVGILIGVPLALGGGRVIAAELFGLAGQNRLYVVGACVVLICVAVAASAMPARRAARVDPLIALRAE